jgi:histidine kinase/YXYXY domain-containing protein/two component regulator with propeller domain
MLACKCIKNFIVLQLYLLLNISDVFSQDYSFVRYDTRDGLAGSVVYDAIQDKEGFMWFATENGLSRFDGKNFKTFTTKDGLPDNEILKLFLDSKGRLWIMPFTPSVCYYYQGKIFNKTNDSLLSKINLITYAFDIAEDASGNLFIAEEKAWHEILKNQTVKTVSKANNSSFDIDAIGVNRHGEVAILVSISTVPGGTHYLIHTSKESLEVKNAAYWPDVQSSLINPDYTIISSHHSSQLSFYRDTSEVISTRIPTNTTSVNYIDRGNVAINTRSGLQFFDPQTKTFSDLVFRDFSFTSAFQDKENNLWLTTAGSGILMVPSLQFRNYSFPDNKKNSEITALSLNGNTLYAAGLNKKMWKINITNMLFSSREDPMLNGSRLVSIFLIDNRIILVSSAYYQNPYDSKNKQPLSIKAASIGKSGIIFAGHSEVLLCKWSGEEDIVWTGRSTSAVEKDSGFYIGTLSGLLYKSYQGNIVNLGNTFSELASRIVNLEVSSDGILWITTKGNGIAAFANNKLLFHVTEADGLTSDNCTSLHLDGSTVWVGTERGLNRIEVSPTGKRITRFSMSDGLPSNMINAIATSGNKVFVGTPMGLTYFEVDKISHASSCDLQITGIYLSNKFWSYDSSNFSLPHRSNDIRFEYSGISFKSAGEMKYQYRLLGLQPEWRTTTDEQLNFPSLSSGKYTLQLRAVNKYGVESGVKEVSFTIEKLLREKTWFRLLMLFLIIDTIWLFFRYRIGTVRKKAKEQAMLNQRIADLEQKALRSQMNPHFIFNSLNSIQQYVAERDITGANNFITDFSKLIRMTLDLSTNAFINLSDEMDYITTYLKVEKTRLENQFDYSINIDSDMNLHEIFVPPLLLQPYVENSIRHGIKYKKENNGMINIRVRRKEADILVSIEDNGIGREAAQQYKSKYHIQYQSKGMTINKDRIDILNSHNDKKIEIFINDLYDKNNEAAGTRVDIYLKQ